jgi:hypothetical protein
LIDGGPSDSIDISVGGITTAANTTSIEIDFVAGGIDLPQG